VWKPFQTFTSLQVSGGLVILLMTVVALLWANSIFGETYRKVWHTSLSIGWDGRTLDKPLHFWINEGLMMFFFFLVGLEIKREVLIGELATVRKAALPVMAAVGGMLVPALIYFVFNPTGVTTRGWAIPTATDIAFTIGVVTLLGNRVPRSLTVFLVALAIADDLGAVLIIALFYTGGISILHLKFVGLWLLFLIVINILGVRRPLPYVVLGSLVWMEVYLSGIHSTVAGILVAMAIPARSRSDTDAFLQGARNLLEEFRCAGPCGFSLYTKAEHQDAVREIENLCLSVQPPLLRIEHTLNPWVVFGVVPLFALANAGVHLDVNTLANALSSPTSLGVFFGLVVGKQIGIFSVSWLTVRLGIAELPAASSWIQLYGCAILCGIGFTMSIFIADLAFVRSDYLDMAKLGILLGSAVSLVVGLTVLYLGSLRQNRRAMPAEADLA